MATRAQATRQLTARRVTAALVAAAVTLVGLAASAAASTGAPVPAAKPPTAASSSPAAKPPVAAKPPAMVKPPTVAKPLTAAQAALNRLASLVPLSFRGTGPDVSSYQHVAPLDWRRVRTTGGFAIIKATEGVGYVNPYFAGDWAEAARAKLPRGAYHFASPAWPVSTADDQARAFVATVGPMNRLGDLPPVLDLEITGGLTPGQLVLWTQEWVRTVRDLTGRTPMLYTYRYFWASMGDTTGLAADRIPLWIADYNGGSTPHLIGGWPTWTLWQYTSSGLQAGISGRVDLSRFHGGVAAMRAFSSGRSAPVERAAPAAPAVSASTDSGQLVVSWVPGSDGWSAPTGWSVRLQPTGQVLTVDAGQASVTAAGMPLGVPLTAVVTAQSAVGTSAPSAPSAPVVLRAPSTLTPLTGPQVVSVGQPVTVRFRFAAPGTPASNRLIRFSATPALGGPDEALGSASTGPDGTVAFTVSPHQGVGLVAAFDGSQTQQPSSSAAVLLRVAPTVSVTAPASAVAGPVRLTGWTDAPAGTPVVVEVATSTGWAVVEQTQAASTGFAVTTIRPAGLTTWRAVVLETAGSLRAQSATAVTSVTAPPPPPAPGPTGAPSPSPAADPTGAPSSAGPAASALAGQPRPIGSGAAATASAAPSHG